MGRRGGAARSCRSAFLPAARTKRKSFGEQAPSARSEDPLVAVLQTRTRAPQASRRQAGFSSFAPGARPPASSRPFPSPSSRRADSMAPPQVLAFGLLLAAATATLAAAEEGEARTWSRSCGVGLGWAGGQRPAAPEAGIMGRAPRGRAFQPVAQTARRCPGPGPRRRRKRQGGAHSRRRGNSLTLQLCSPR
ncbi:uncharacterized protein LOC116547204 [Sapajus apella]|uniref:Uncharacterized protein LOC116547204 n=1 Tax=Sapajus apella TaxID=9515 RepID=A0A6J3HGN4_SAPAP|nr:uncharacterized protein LOC116547204 [Sapajus apella]